MAWVIFIVFILAAGIWTKWRNTIYMRALAAEVKKQDADNLANQMVVLQHSEADDHLGVAEMGVETMGEDNPKGGPNV